jgi:type I restriction enzyme S subunit
MGMTAAVADASPAGLPEGYKVSDVGVIPEEWEVVSLSDLLDFRNGVNADKSAYGRGIRFINVLEVITRSHLRACDVPGRVTLSRAAIKAYAVRAGDVVFNRTSETLEEVGLAAVYQDDEPVVFGGFVIRGRPQSAALDARYAGYGLRAAAVREQIIKRGQGAIRANIGQADLRQVLVPIPPLPEQRAIGAALADADKLIGGLDRAIAKKLDVQQGVMRELLTGCTRLPGFKEGWDVVSMREIGTLRSGSGFPLEYQGETRGAYPLFKVSDMSRAGNEVSLVDAGHWISEDVRRKLGATVFPTDAIVFAKVGAAVFLERKRLLTRPSCLDNNMMAFTFDHDRAEPRFMHWLLQHTKLSALVAPGALPSLNAKEVGAVSLRLPPIAEQRAITSVLDDVEGEINALRTRQKKAREVKAGMASLLLAGKVRLTPSGALA